MRLSELLGLINQGEGAKLEFKRDDARPENMAKEIVAFANMSGGTILAGVEDNGDISGVQKDNFQEWLMDMVIGRYVHPHILPDYEEIVHENERVAVVKVPQGSSKPYVLRHNDRDEIYMRYGDTCRIASREQRARLFESGGLVSVEKMPVHGSGLEDLDQKRLRDYFVNLSGVIDEQEWQDFSKKDIVNWLTNRDLMRCEEDGDCVCTISGMALFGLGVKAKLRLPQASIRLAVFPGTDKDYNPLLDTVISPPFTRLGKPEDSYSEPSVPDRVLSYLQPHTSEERLDDGVTRERHWDYPREVIRELVVNAFAHRDWTKNTDIEVSVYADRMEIISPGALVNGMTVEKVKAGQRAPRNQNMVNVLRDYGLMEHQGMGIRRKVVPLMKEHNGREPDCEATEDHFKVTLWKKSTN